MNRALTPNARQRLIDQHLEAGPEYVRHGGEHPGTKTPDNAEARRRKRKAEKQARKRARN